MGMDVAAEQASDHTDGREERQVCWRCSRGFSVVPTFFNRAGFFLMREYHDIFPC